VRPRLERPERECVRAGNDDDVKCEVWTMASTDLTIHHPNTLVSDFEPDFTAQTNDEPDVVL
jgi:hypothetical protein